MFEVEEEVEEREVAVVSRSILLVYSLIFAVEFGVVISGIRDRKGNIKVRIICKLVSCEFYMVIFKNINF